MMQAQKNTSHPDGIYSVPTARAGKQSYWLPYLESVEKIKGGIWKATYNGGEVEIDLTKTDSIMFYGASGTVPLAFLDELAKHGVSAILHRRNMPVPLVIHRASIPASQKDNLTLQIITRENETKRKFVAKTLIRERLKSMRWLIPVPDTKLKMLRQSKDAEEVLKIESEFSRKYWKEYAKKAGLAADWTRRGNDVPVSMSLDAGSKFFHGIILRWILVHHLSPAHGFLHRPTSYTSLVYDLMEPYRYIIEIAVFEAVRRVGVKDESKLIAVSTNKIKEMLNEWVDVPTHKCRVRRKNLLHGAVLALMAYLDGSARHPVWPTEGKLKGGRPVNTGYAIPGCAKR